MASRKSSKLGSPLTSSGGAQVEISMLEEAKDQGYKPARLNGKPPADGAQELIFRADSVTPTWNPFRFE